MAPPETIILMIPHRPKTQDNFIASLNNFFILLSDLKFNTSLATSMILIKKLLSQTKLPYLFLLYP